HGLDDLGSLLLGEAADLLVDRFDDIGLGHSRHGSTLSRSLRSSPITNRNRCRSIDRLKSQWTTGLTGESARASATFCRLAASAITRALPSRHDRTLACRCYARARVHSREIRAERAASRGCA